MYTWNSYSKAQSIRNEAGVHTICKQHTFAIASSTESHNPSGTPGWRWIDPQGRCQQSQPFPHPRLIVVHIGGVPAVRTTGTAFPHSRLGLLLLRLRVAQLAKKSCICERQITEYAVLLSAKREWQGGGMNSHKKIPGNHALLLVI